MLDEEHERLSPASDRDDNAYVFGEIGNHNIVIACMPMGMTGNTPAALVAKDLLHSFHHLQFYLMVGIGGGAPNEQNDIRLGDVVVSAPTGQHGGVVQYDFGKTLAEGRLYRTGTLNRPPNVLLSTLSYLRSTYELLGHPTFLKHLATVISRYPHHATTFSYPRGIYDTLFEADYDHAMPLQPCEAGCDYGRVIGRGHRASNYPSVFFGNIASANQVMRHGLTRDRIAREHNVLCFEMEAAGLMDQFPCLVIRGISDYADSHKDDRWQDYASAVAAAFAKDLLLVTPARDIRDRHHDEHARRQPTRSRDTDSPGAMSSQSKVDNNRTRANRPFTPQSSTYASLDALPSILPDPRSFDPRYKIMPSAYFEVGKIFSIVDSASRSATSPNPWLSSKHNQRCAGASQ
ncbi:nucleoside phosphorylase domain-containing protein [Aspergillus sergii]|uniref:Nucleoside phosphorylase domain-containing protein n=1 Tax=Aspergillus sergii TaxID=1034303 RepID=A0A5N6WRP5_9EURO|nr:nucleoside phosphorylase domain-containing protein [Aspergillus sergii]